LFELACIRFSLTQQLPHSHTPSLPHSLPTARQFQAKPGFSIRFSTLESYYNA
jgi:hypothetical protein